MPASPTSTKSGAFPKGKTTKAEVKAKFGDPISTMAKERGAKEWSYKMPGSGSAVKIPGFERFFGSEKDKALIVAFDRRGIVTNYTLHEIEGSQPPSR